MVFGCSSRAADSTINYDSDDLSITISTADERPPIATMDNRVALEPAENNKYLFAVSDKVVPRYSVYEERDESGAVNIVVRVSVSTKRSVLQTIQIISLRGEEIRISDADDWSAVAGPQPQSRLAQFRRTCEGLPRGRALEVFGVNANYSPNIGETVVFSSGKLVSCPTANHDRSLGIVISAGERRFLFSNVVGQAYLEEI